MKICFSLNNKKEQDFVKILKKQKIYDINRIKFREQQYLNEIQLFGISEQLNPERIVIEKYGQLIVYKNIEGKNDIEVKLYEENVWLNQKQLVDLFDSSKSNISEHIKHIFEEKELEEDNVTKIFPIIAEDGKKYNVKYYNLDMILAIGYRVKSDIGTNFRQWATETLKEYVVKGFTLNDNLLKNAGGGRYFKQLLARIRDIRTAEKVFWRQILDIYATSVDYNPKSEISIEFFKEVQNKMHWASHGHTAAEIIMERADSEKDFMGLTNFEGNQPTLQEAIIAKNYLTEKELDVLNRIVTMYLDYAELQALNENPMTMRDWVNELDYFIKMNRKDVLQTKGTVSHKDALEKARDEYKKYKERISLNPTEVELHYLEATNELKKIADRK